MNQNQRKSRQKSTHPKPKPRASPEVVEVLDSVKGLNTFDEQVSRFIELNKPSLTRVEAFKTLVARLEQHLNEDPIFRTRSGKRYVVEPFGSFLTGTLSKNSDLDLCIIDPDHPDGFDEKFLRSAWIGVGDVTGLPPHEKWPRIYQTNVLAKAIRRWGFRNVTPIKKTIVPIVKFQALINGEVIDVDINANQQLGLRNSRLIVEYSRLFNIFNECVLLIKFWAKAKGLHDPAGKSGVTSFSTYAWILLFITFLQEEGLVPNLQSRLALVNARTEESMFWTIPRVETIGNSNNIVHSVGWDTSFIKTVGNADGGRVSSCFRAFFKWLRDLDVIREVVSPREGRLLRRIPTKSLPETRPRRASSPRRGEDQPPMQIWKRHPLVVQDLFICTRNVTQNIRRGTINRLQLEAGRVVLFVDSNRLMGDICAPVEQENLFVDYKSWFDVRIPQL